MKQETSLQTRLEEQISRQAPGELIFPGDCLELGTVTAIRMCLRHYLSDSLLYTRELFILLHRLKLNLVYGPSRTVQPDRSLVAPE